MAIQVLVIGLGQFGMSLARSLEDKGAEVIGVDKSEDIIMEAAQFLDDAVCLDAADESSLLKLGPKERDIVICAIGSREDSILTTALLMQIGCENIIARASDKIHERILKAVGAKSVINPDAEYGRRLANKIVFRNIITDYDSTELQLNEINIQPFMVGKNLIELALPNKYGIIVAALKRKGKVVRPLAHDPLLEGDKLMLVCSDEAITNMLKQN